MTGYPAPPGQLYGAGQADLLTRVRTLEQQIAQLTAGAMLDQKVLTAPSPSIGLAVPSGNFGTLRVAWTARSDYISGAATYMCLRLNGDSGTSYVWQINQANNTTSGPGNSGGATSLIQIGTMAAATASAGYLGSGEFIIPNATGSQFKAPSGYSTSMNATTNGYSGTYGGLWLSTAVVTSITLFAKDGNNLIAGSSAYLYGMP